MGEEIHNHADRLFKIIGEAYAVLSDPTKVLNFITMLVIMVLHSFTGTICLYLFFFFWNICSGLTCKNATTEQISCTKAWSGPIKACQHLGCVWGVTSLEA